jgi:hypothetical protein
MPPRKAATTIVAEPDFPQTFSTLVDDVLHAAVAEIDPTFWVPATFAVVAGAALLGASLVPWGRGAANAGNWDHPSHVL